MTKQNPMVIAILFGYAKAQTTSNLEFDDTLASCLKFAAQFDNTCTDLSNAPASVADVPTASMTCIGIGQCPNHGTGDDTSCTFTRKLCISCKEENSKVYITTQGNNMPSHCFRSPTQVPQEKNIMYKARWLAPVSSSRRRALEEFTEAPDPLRMLQPSGSGGPGSGGGSSDSGFFGLFGGSGSGGSGGSGPSGQSATDAVPIVNTQEDVNSLICNIMRSQDSSIPSEAEYTNTSNEMIATAWGMSTSGMLIYNGISGEDTDPFYPAAYGKCNDPTNCVEKVDKCLSHPEMTGGLHYHIAPTCVGDPNWIDQTKAVETHNEADDILAAVRDAWDIKPYRSVFGLAKDGRPIYGPFYDKMKEYGDCYVDICNGRMINGHYSYVSTFFHPYIMGCYGPGNNPPYAQQCSANPRKCGVLVVEGSSLLRTSIISLGLSLAVYINTMY